MKILTWNVERPKNKETSRKRLEEITAPLVAKVISYDPDIAILTETHRSVDLGEGYHSIWTEPSSRKALEGEAVACIFSRWPLKPIGTFDNTEAVAAEVDHPHLQLIVYGSIIVYFGYKGADGESKPYEEQLKSIEQHGRDWKTIRENFPNHELIVGGDFNTRLNVESSEKQTKLQLHEHLRASGLTPLTDNTFGELGQHSNGAIDHICVSQRLVAKPNVCEWYDEKLSDHSLILATIEIG